nr:hypothetical protein [Tanacetum cinerariifolium]
MVAILEKGEFNTDFHPMVDFIAASPLRYALTVKPTIFVSHIRQFWSTARIETTDEGTHILVTVDGIQRTVSEASLRHNLKLSDEDGIVSIPDTELFENLTLMGIETTDEGTHILATVEDDAPIKGRSINEGEATAERISDNSEELARVLTTMDAATVLAGGIDEHVKKQKTSEEALEIEKSTQEIPEEKMKEMMQLGRIVGNKMHKAFPLLVRKFPLPEGDSYCLKKNATARRKVLPLPEVCTGIIVKEKPPVKDDSFL